MSAERPTTPRWRPFSRRREVDAAREPRPADRDEAQSRTINGADRDIPTPVGVRDAEIPDGRRSTRDDGVEQLRAETAHAEHVARVVQGDIVAGAATETDAAWAAQAHTDVRQAAGAAPLHTPTSTRLAAGRAAARADQARRNAEMETDM